MLYAINDYIVENFTIITILLADAEAATLILT